MSKVSSNQLFHMSTIGLEKLKKIILDILVEYDENEMISKIYNYLDLPFVIKQLCDTQNVDGLQDVTKLIDNIIQTRNLGKSFGSLEMSVGDFHNMLEFPDIVFQTVYNELYSRNELQKLLDNTDTNKVASIINTISKPNDELIFHNNCLTNDLDSLVLVDLVNICVAHMHKIGYYVPNILCPDLTHCLNNSYDATIIDLDTVTLRKYCNILDTIDEEYEKTNRVTILFQHFGNLGKYSDIDRIKDLNNYIKQIISHRLAVDYNKDKSIANNIHHISEVNIIHQSTDLLANELLCSLNTVLETKDAMRTFEKYLTPKDLVKILSTKQLSDISIYWNGLHIYDLSTNSLIGIKWLIANTLKHRYCSNFFINLNI